MKRGWWILKFLVFGIVCLGLLGAVTMLLWNWLVPELFSGPHLTFWQALGLLALTKILFWTFGKGGGGHWKHRQAGGWGYFWAKKMEGMSAEDKERFKQKMNEKWCTPNRGRSFEDQNTSNNI